MYLPNIITNTPSIIKLVIFEDEQIHLPFHIECVPSDLYKIVVVRLNKDKVVSEYEVSPDYNNKFNKLLEDLGIIIKDEKWMCVSKL